MDMISHCELLSSPFLHGHVIALRADICSLVPPEQAPGPELSPRSSCFSLSSYFYASRCAAAGIMFCKEAQKEVGQTIFVVVQHREPPIQTCSNPRDEKRAPQRVANLGTRGAPWPSSHFADIDSVVSFLSSAHRLSEEDITCRRALSAQGCDFRRWWWQPE